MKRESSSSVGVGVGLGVGGLVCSNCRSEDRWVLHHVHHRSTYRRLCTTCVLKLNNTSYCPICFTLHNRNSNSNSNSNSSVGGGLVRGSQSQSVLVCFKCNSRSHAGCVSSNTPKSPYLCPCCSNPHLKLFDFKRSTKTATAPPADDDMIQNQKNLNQNQNQNQVIDLKSSKVFLAAALIAENSLKEAADQARVQAERKAKEAVASRKRAKDALERTALVWAREHPTPPTPTPTLLINNNDNNNNNNNNGHHLHNLTNNGAGAGATPTPTSR